MILPNGWNTNTLLREMTMRFAELNLLHGSGSYAERREVTRRRSETIP